MHQLLYVTLDWILQDLPTSFDTPLDETPITPGLVHYTLYYCSLKSSPGFDRITYNHLRHLPLSHYFFGYIV